MSCIYETLGSCQTLVLILIESLGMPDQLSTYSLSNELRERNVDRRDVIAIKRFAGDNFWLDGC